MFCIMESSLSKDVWILILTETSEVIPRWLTWSLNKALNATHLINAFLIRIGIILELAFFPPPSSAGTRNKVKTKLT